MDTTKTSNPSGDAEGADDLIEELARLMADDAQINTPSAKPVTAGSGIATPPSVAETGLGAPEAKSTVPSAPSVPSSSGGSAVPSASETPEFDLNAFDLGTPKAQTSSLSVPDVVTEKGGAKDSAPATPAAPFGQTPNKTASDQGASTTQAEQTVQPEKIAKDFDFGFGVGPDDAEKPAAAWPASSQEMPQKADAQIQTPQSEAVQNHAPQADVDPIADLINAAVSKHDNAGPTIEDAPATDTFTTPPVFGLEGTAAAPDSSLGGSVALDEIETLIGNSVVVEDAETIAPTPQEFDKPTGDETAQMAVEGPPISSGPLDNIVPHEANIAPMPATGNEPSAKSTQSNPDSAEAAILQAMAAAGTAATAKQSGAPAFPENSTTNPQPQLAPGRVSKPAKQKQSLSNYLMPVLGILVVGAIGVGAYFWLNPGTGSENAPVLVAEEGVTREDPTPTAQAEESVVLNQIDGTTAPVETESLVSRDETGGETVPVIRQVVTTDNSSAGLANRRVRTVTVRPDGTIISGEDAVAGGQVLPVEVPTLPDLPADAVNTELSNTVVAALPQGAEQAVNVETVTVNGSSVPFPRPRIANRTAVAQRSIVAETQLPTSTGVSASTDAVEQTTTAAVNLVDGAPAAPTIETNPVVQAATPVAPANVEIVSIVDEPTPTPAATTTTLANPQAFVQLASQRSQSVANSTAANLQSQFSSALNGGSLVVRRVDLGTRGIYYRVQLPTASLRSANSICDAVKSAGGDCFTRSN